MADQIDDYPQRHAADTGAEVARIAVSVVPFGGSVSRLFDLVFTPSIEKRRSRWFDELADLVAQLSADQVTPSQLSDDDEWISAVDKASRVALGTHLDEKIAMLKALLRRYALAVDRDEFAVSRFIRLVDELEPIHFGLLRLSREPMAWASRDTLDRAIQQRVENLDDVLRVFGIETDQPTAVAAVRDLEDKWLVKMPTEPNGDWFSHNLLAGEPWILATGREFLEWVEAFE
ncbi:MAG: hypothetical protein AAGA65_22235 [Actinomycetota bacterium]